MIFPIVKPAFINFAKRLIWFAALFILAVSLVSADPLIPLRKGMVWIYEGKVEWLNADNKVESKNIRWTTEIVEVFNYQKTRVAVIRGFPSELAWYDENRRGGFSVLIFGGNNIYNLETDSKKEAFHLARRVSRGSKEYQQSTNPLLFKPLLKLPPRYFSIKGFDSRRKLECEQSVHRTNPDIETIAFARGLGIVRYSYNHFGTTSSADVELKEIRFPRKGKIKPVAIN